MLRIATWRTELTSEYGVLRDKPVPGILQARILEWLAILFSRGSSQPRD